MSSAKLILAGLLVLALCGAAGPAAAADPLQSPYGGQNSPAYSGQAATSYGGGQPGYPPAQPPAYPPAAGYGQAPAPGGPTLIDVIGNFRLGLPQGAVAGGATYNFSLPNQQVQVSIMSLANAQAFLAQQQGFASLMTQMGGRITEQRQINLGGRPAELVVALVSPPPYNAQTLAYNVFVASANLWLQVTGAAQNQAQVQQATSQLLQALNLR